MFRVIVEEVTRTEVGEGVKPHESAVERFRQTVDAIDLKKVIAAVNAKPRAPRVRKAKAAAQ